MNTIILGQLFSEFMSLIVVTAILTTIFGVISGIFYSAKYYTYRERFWNRLPIMSCIGCIAALFSKLLRKGIVHGQVVFFWQTLNDSGWCYIIIMFISDLLIAFNFTKWLAMVNGYEFDFGRKHHITKCRARPSEAIAQKSTPFPWEMNKSSGQLNRDKQTTKRSVPSNKESRKAKVDYDNFFRIIKQFATDFRDSFAGQYGLETGQSAQGEAYGRAMYQFFISYYAVLLDVNIKERYANVAQYRAEHDRLVKAFAACRDISIEVAENYLTKEDVRKMLIEVFDDLRKQGSKIPSSIYLKLADTELNDI